MDLNISSVFHQRYFPCPRKQQRSSSFNLFGVPSNLCLTFKSPSGSREHRADHYVQLCSSRQSEMLPESHSRGKKNNRMYVWIYMAPVVWNLQHIGDKVRNKMTLKQSRGWKDSHELSSPGEDVLLRIIVNQPYSPTLSYCGVTGRGKWEEKLLVSVSKTVEVIWSVYSWLLEHFQRHTNHRNIVILTSHAREKEGFFIAALLSEWCLLQMTVLRM